MIRDPYAVLGLKRDATEDDAKKAYRKLAMEYHPDRNPGDKAKEEKFKEISAAYEQIKNPQPQHDFDNFSNRGGGFNPFGQGFSNLDDILHAFHSHNRQRNRDVQADVQLTLEEAFYGRDIKITLQSQKDSKVVDVKIPPGVDNGSVIRVASVGDNSFSNMPAGDLHVVIHLRNHNVFTRMTKDLLTKIEMDVFDVMLGTTVGVMGIDGKRLEVTVPPNFNPKHRLKLSGQGMPIVNTQVRGDLLVEVGLTFPVLSEDQQKMLKTIKEIKAA